MSKRLYSNELTVAIKKGITIIELLSSKDLSITVRNEAIEFIDFLFPPEEMKKDAPNLSNLKCLIDLSLVPDKGQKEKYHLYQLSRNAANIFASPSRKLHEMLRQDKSKIYFKSLRNFIFGENTRDPMFAGHFQRIFEMTLRNSGEVLMDKDAYNDKFNNEILPFIIKNSDLLPYRELLSAIMSEFTNFFPSSIDDSLRYAAIAALHIDEETEATQLLNKSAKLVYTDNVSKKKEEFIRKTQPLNCKKKPLPIPYFIKCPDSSSSFPPPDPNFTEKLKTELSYNDLQYNDIIHFEEPDNQEVKNKAWVRFALNLIYAVKNAYEMDIDNVMLNKIEQDEKEEKKSNIVQCLLVCGMYADSDSPLSYTSFNLLFNLLNKPHQDSNGVYDDKYILNLHPPKIVKEYAQHFKFDSYDITEKMVSGLLIFWNQHYVNDEDKDTEKKEVIQGYKPSAGATPLQILLPSVLTEPICSSKLNNIFMRIISSMEQEIIDTKDKDEKNQDDGKNNDSKCFQFDCIWYELLTYKFKLLPEENEEETNLFRALQRLLPLSTTDKTYHPSEKEKNKAQFVRAPTNPVFFLLTNIINHGAFFTYKRGTEFRKMFTESIDVDWAFEAFTYYNIIKKTEENLLALDYTKGPIHNKNPKDFPLNPKFKKIDEVEKKDDDK